MITESGEDDENKDDEFAKKEEQMGYNPFGKGTLMSRSPKGAKTGDLDLPKGVNSEGVQPRSDPFVELGSLIVGLLEYMKPRNNIHHAIKEQVRAIRAMYNKVREEKTIDIPMEVPEIMEQATQTSPKIDLSVTETKRNRESPEVLETPNTTKKRKKLSKLNKLEKNDVHTKEKVSDIHSEENGSDGNIDNVVTKKNEAWNTVSRKKRHRFPATKPDVMIISAKGEMTYADIIRKLKTDPDLKEFGQNVNKIRRSQKGDLMLEIKSSNGESVESFNEKIGKSLEGQVDIMTRRNEMIIECKDMDEITTKGDICVALEEQLQTSGLEEEQIKSIRKAYGGTQTAKISLPLPLAKKALSLGKIRIGWSICRLREVVSLKKCYKCLEFGHIATGCKNNVDRSKLCRKCGGENHIAKNCTKEPECMFCKSNGEKDLKHVAGSFKCPVFKKALNFKK